MPCPSSERLGLDRRANGQLRLEVGGKYIAAPDLQNLGAMGELHSHFDHGIIFHRTDHARDPGLGLELVRDQVNTVCDFHAL